MGEALRAAPGALWALPRGLAGVGAGAVGVAADPPGGAVGVQTCSEVNGAASGVPRAPDPRQLRPACGVGAGAGAWSTGLAPLPPPTPPALGPVGKALPGSKWALQAGTGHASAHRAACAITGGCPWVGDPEHRAVGAADGQVRLHKHHRRLLAASEAPGTQGAPPESRSDPAAGLGLPKGLAFQARGSRRTAARPAEAGAADTSSSCLRGAASARRPPSPWRIPGAAPLLAGGRVK